MDNSPGFSPTPASLPQDSQIVEQPLVNDINEFDSLIMLRCLELARTALGRTSPNPLVGAVVVQNGQILGEGFHPCAGEPHAEVFALRAAGAGARGSTVYVNLEPCNHYGRTPPCSEGLINAGVSKVVVGMVDPNPLVAGRGIARLRDAGIEVVVGVEEAACRRLNEGFIHRILYQRPLGILKYAMTLDGKIATTTGHSAWITNKDARTQVHCLRAACDAVIVGGNTVRKDNPYLTSHQVEAHNPLRVVMSRSLNLPEQARLWDTQEAATLVLTQVGSSQTFQKMLWEKGVEVLEFSSLTPETVMTHLYERGFAACYGNVEGFWPLMLSLKGQSKKLWHLSPPKLLVVIMLLHL